MREEYEPVYHKTFTVGHYSLHPHHTMPKQNQSNVWQEVERSSTARAHKAEVDELKKQISSYQQVIADLNAQVDVASLLKSTPVSGQTFKIDRKSKAARESAAVIVASDWHVEESVDPRTVSNLNAFNLEVADRRIERFCKKALRLIEIQRGGTDIPILVLALLGDLMSGFIHEELREENELTPTQTVLWLKERVAKFINTLRNEGNFDQIIIPCSVGNHGRTTIKPRHGTSWKNSYEWLLYKILEQEITDKVTWIIGESYHTYLEVYGKTFRLHHGDSLVYKGGVGGLTIPVEKAIANWNKGRVADLDIFGHWHQSQQNPKWISNGSLIGHNAYSISIKAPYEPPQQSLFLFDSRRGRTGTWPIFVED
jgi:hypothetical protein